MTKFVFSINPKWTDTDFMDMMELGIHCFRINAVRHHPDEIKRIISFFNGLPDGLSENVKLFFDMPGSKARIWHSKTNRKTLDAGTYFRILLSDKPQESDVFWLTGDEVFDGISSGDEIIIRRATYEQMRFKVIEKEKNVLFAVALTDLTIGWGYQVINLNNYKILKKMSKADQSFISLATLLKPTDIIGISFADSPEIIDDFKRETKGATKLFYSKLETPYAVNRINDLMQVSDGIIIGRDDLLSWYSQEEINELTYTIIETCKNRKIPVVAASNFFLSIGQGGKMTSSETRIFENTLSLQPDYIYINETSRNDVWRDFFEVIKDYI